MECLKVLPSVHSDRMVVVLPPFVVDTELRVTAVDVGLSGRLPHATSGQVAICLGGHPAAECLLDATGSGATHDVVVAIDESQPRHHQFADRIRRMVTRETPVLIVPLPKKTTESRADPKA